MSPTMTSDTAIRFAYALNCVIGDLQESREEFLVICDAYGIDKNDARRTDIPRLINGVIAFMLAWDVRVKGEDGTVSEGS